jgi:hypothetical protein
VIFRSPGTKIPAVTKPRIAAPTPRGWAERPPTRSLRMLLPKSERFLHLLDEERSSARTRRLSPATPRQRQTRIRRTVARVEHRRGSIESIARAAMAGVPRGIQGSWRAPNPAAAPRSARRRRRWRRSPRPAQISPCARSAFWRPAGLIVEAPPGGPSAAPSGPGGSAAIAATEPRSGGRPSHRAANGGRPRTGLHRVARVNHCSNDEEAGRFREEDERLPGPFRNSAVTSARRGTRPAPTEDAGWRP